VALSSPAAARRCNAWRWLVVAFFAKQKQKLHHPAKQKQKLHHQQLTNGSTILFTFTFLVNLDLFNLSIIYSIFWINFSEFIISDPHTEDVACRRTKEWCQSQLALATLMMQTNIPFLNGVEYAT